MGYFTINISPASQDMTTIVTEFGQFRYNLLPMGIYSSGGVFQAKVDELLGDINDVKTYIDDILILSNNLFRNNIEQLRMIFGSLHAEGLKVNAPKCSFGVKDNPYLIYVITM